MKQKFEHCLASWFGLGHAPVASGTIGTLGAVPLYWLYSSHTLTMLMLLVILIPLGVVISNRVVDRMGDKDPSMIVIDEVAGFLLAVIFFPFTWVNLVALFLLFRFFDIAKFWPMSALERLPRGWGVMADDLAAGILAALLWQGIIYAYILLF